MAGGDTWLVSPGSGLLNGGKSVVWHVTNGIQATVLEGLGWRAFATKAEADAFARLNPLQKTGADASAAVQSAAGATGISGFLSRLTQASTWIRVGEVLLGLILIAVGLARLTSAVPVATRVARAAGTAAVL